jgi:nicotinamide phosphoribosyltransferase
MKENKLNENLILKADSYKYSHIMLYPQGVEYMMDYMESRGGKFDKTRWFGLQIYLKKYLTTPVTMEDVNEANEFLKAHGEPFDFDGWKYIVEKHNGYLPIKIRAVPEGTLVPTGNVLMTIESTDPKVFWIVSFVETLLLKIWYPTTVSTLSFQMKEIIRDSFERTSDLKGQDLDMSLNFKLHDFGYRGVSSEESAGIGGCAHLTNFWGSDTIEGIRYANFYYNKNQMSSFSIPATEHSTITSWGINKEIEAYKNVIEKFGGKFPIIACVSDSYNIYNACEKIWGEELKDLVINCGSTLVIRPDSGIPEEVVPKILNILDKQFGSVINSKGYKILNKVRIIQGDGITIDSTPKIIQMVEENGFSIENIAFGMGGGLLQHGIDRDTQKFAIKCCAIKISGELREVSKNPIDDSTKKSKGGLLELIFENNQYKTIKRSEIKENTNLVLVDVFENGKILKEFSLEEIRKINI